MNSMIKVLDLSLSDAWQLYWERLPVAQRSVYLLPEYYRVYERMGHGKATCFIYENEKSLLIYPFLKKSINIDGCKYFDVEGAYGLNGVGGEALDDRDIEIVQKAWSEYCISEGVLAEFTRLNPLLNSQYCLPHLTCSLANRVVVVDLQCPDLLYLSYEHSVRKAIKKAIRQGAVVASYASVELSVAHLKIFSHIYHATMDRKSASDYYHFGLEYFEYIKEFVGNNARWFFASINNEVVSVELVLFDETIAYSFLGGTLPEYFSCGVNVILKHEIILYFQGVGLTSFFLGGGVSPNDGIYKYKKSFCKSASYEFYIGKKVHLSAIYDSAVKKWEMINPDKKEKYKNYFLKYRC